MKKRIVIGAVAAVAAIGVTVFALPAEAANGVIAAVRVSARANGV